MSSRWERCESVARGTRTEKKRTRQKKEGRKQRLRHEKTKKRMHKRLTDHARAVRSRERVDETTRCRWRAEEGVVADERRREKKGRTQKTRMQLTTACRLLIRGRADGTRLRRGEHCASVCFFSRREWERDGGGQRCCSHQKREEDIH